MPLDNSRSLLGLASLAYLEAVLALITGCNTTVTCEDTATCEPIDMDTQGGGGGHGGTGDAHAGASGSAGTGGVGGAAGGSGGGGAAGSVAGTGGSSGTNDAGSDVEAAPPCVGTKRPAEDACVIDERYGIFVSPTGNDAAGGTRVAPLKTIGKGLQAAKAAGKRVYVCDNGTGYAEQVVIDAALDGVVGFGGFTCDWTYVASSRAVVKPAASPVLVMKTLTMSTVLENFELDAPDATAAGTSSIAAIVDSASSVTLRNVRIVAGRGGAGQPGVNGLKGDDGFAAAVVQRGTDSSCGGAAPPVQLGGNWPSMTPCGSIGGPGGFTSKGLNGSPGVPGVPDTNVNPPMVDNGGTEGPTGGDGLAGSPGIAGTLGAASTTAGVFTAVGYTAASSGSSGTDGNTGQGGGGGGGSNATGTCIGASGGAGGMGGCGGKLGTGGASGGASVALLSWMSTNVVLDGCELTSKEGGAGGRGGDGGAMGLGSDGALGGVGLSSDGGPTIGAAGKGGLGGNGGLGGSGAGGNGGPSYALVVKGTAPMQMGLTILLAGVGGALGGGGSVGGRSAPDGIAGASRQQFVAP